jgi:hypothetical protein
MSRVEELTADRCWELLRLVPVGRLEKWLAYSVTPSSPMRLTAMTTRSIRLEYRRQGPGRADPADARTTGISAAEAGPTDATDA